MDNIVFQILSKLGGNFNKDNGVMLTPGETINVYVKKILANQALLQYKGKLILAQLESPVAEGARVRCLVEGKKNGKILLKLLNGEGNISPQKFKALVSGMLKNAGIPESEFSRAVVTSMLKQEAPVTKETLESILKSAYKLQVNIKETDRLVFLHKQGIPINGETISLFNESPDKSDSLGRQLADLRTLLLNMQNAKEAKSLKIPENLKLAERILAVLDKMMGRVGEGSQTTAQKVLFTKENLLNQNIVAKDLSGAVKDAKDSSSVKDVKNLSGTAVNDVKDLRGAIKDVKDLSGVVKDVKDLSGVIQDGKGQSGVIQDDKGLSGTVKGSKDVPNMLGDIVPDNSAKLKSVLENIVPRLLNLAEKGGNHGENEFVFNIKEILSENRTIYDETVKQKLTDLLNRLQENLQKEDHPLVKQLSGKISEVIGKINSYQQINRAELGQTNMFYIQAPADPQNSSAVYEVLVKFKKDENKKDLNYDNCQVFVSLNTLRYGLVRARVQLKGRNLNCCFSVENEAAKKTVDNKAFKLVENLQKLGFDIVLRPAEVRKENETALIELIGNKEELPLISRVDVRV